MASKKYASSIVLGLNDALVELTGALTGLTFALRNSRLIAMIGIIIGFAASLSMSASEYLSSKEELGVKKGSTEGKPLKKALYTGVSYLLTVFILISPYLIFNNVFMSLTVTILLAFLIIAFYTYKISTIKSVSFWKRFSQMALIFLGVAFISFFLGVLLRNYFAADI